MDCEATSLTTSLNARNFVLVLLLTDLVNMGDSNDIDYDEESSEVELTVAHYFIEAGSKFAKRPALAVREKENWKGITWQEYVSEAQKVARTLIGRHLEKGDRVCLIGSNSPVSRIFTFSDLS